MGYTTCKFRFSNFNHIAMIFFKYEFDVEKWEALKPSLQITYNEGEETICIYDREVVTSVVELGFIIDENERPSNKFSVDILWKNDESPNFSEFKIFPSPIGIHSFGDSIDELYEEAFNNNNI